MIRAFGLRGAVVSMAAEPLTSGVVYVRDGRVLDVRQPAEPIPDGFSPLDPIFETDGVIYPGLLDLHNHLPYNVLPPWKVPKRFDQRSDWIQHCPEYKRTVSEPMAGWAKGGEPILKAIVRYVEVKLLMGGATSGQGMSAQLNGRHYEGMVRNFERPVAEGLPRALTKVTDVDSGSLERFTQDLDTGLVMLHHLAESVLPQTIEDVFVFLETHGLIRANLVGIHSLALGRPEFERMTANGARVVWSPLSNSLLYGSSINPAHLTGTGIPFGLGSDWTPSGSRNLLLELKAAWLHSQAVQDGPGCRVLCGAVTNVAAETVGWGHAVGTLEADKLADILVLDRRVPDPFENLVRATERDVRLVLIDGVPRYGDATLVTGFQVPDTDLEPLTVGGRSKRLHTRDEGSPLNGLTFTRAAEVLSDAMSHLDDLPINALHESAIGGMHVNGQSFIEFDMQSVSGPLFANAIDAIPPLAALTSVTLDPPTVIDDPGYFDTIESVGHLPPFLRGAQGLRGLYS